MSTVILPEGANDTGFVAHRGNPEDYTSKGKLKKEVYEAEIEHLQQQLVQLQY